MSRFDSRSELTDSLLVSPIAVDFWPRFSRESPSPTSLEIQFLGFFATELISGISGVFPDLSGFQGLFCSVNFSAGQRVCLQVSWFLPSISG